MHRARSVIGPLRSGLVATGLLFFAAWLQAWTGPAASGKDGDDAKGGPATRDPRKRSISGSGTSTTLYLPTRGVTVLLVDAGFSVHVRIGEPEQAAVRIDENVADLIEAWIESNQLRLGLRPGSHVRNATLSAEVTVRRLDQVTAAGTSQVHLDSELVGERLVLTVLGMSEITGALRVERVEAGMSGASRLVLSGQVERLGITASGASEVMLSGVAVSDLDARLSGASTAEVTVRDTLTVQTSGASTLRYRGTPQIPRQQSTGASTVAPAG